MEVWCEYLTHKTNCLRIVYLIFGLFFLMPKFIICLVLNQAVMICFVLLNTENIYRFGSG